jgi:hypothetical protein
MPDTPPRKRAFDTYDLTLVETAKSLPATNICVLPFRRERNWVSCGPVRPAFYSPRRRRASTGLFHRFFPLAFGLFRVVRDVGGRRYLIHLFHNMKVGDKIQGMVPLGTS